jgi:hypothetical protein
MTERRFYIGIENLGLNDSQRATLVEELKRLGRQDYPNPCLNNHWTTRPDNQAVIFEALFEEELWTIEQIKQRLATIFGINVSLITHSVANSQYGPLVTFTRTTERLRMVVFGGVNATYDESHAACLTYLLDHQAAWEI